MSVQGVKHPHPPHFYQLTEGSFSSALLMFAVTAKKTQHWLKPFPSQPAREALPAELHTVLP